VLVNQLRNVPIQLFQFFEFCSLGDVAEKENFKMFCDKLRLSAGWENCAREDIMKPIGTHNYFVYITNKSKPYPTKKSTDDVYVLFCDFVSLW
jgi:hypothetical protein